MKLRFVHPLLLMVIVLSAGLSTELQTQSTPASTPTPLIAFYTPRDTADPAGAVDLVVLDPVTREERVYPLAPGSSEPTHLAWSIDYSQLAISYIKKNYSSSTMSTLQLSDGSLHTLAENVRQDTYAGSFSPDGANIFFTQTLTRDPSLGWELYSLSLEGDHADPQLLTPRNVMVTDAFWGDHNTLALTGFDHAESIVQQGPEAQVNGDIFMIDLSTRTLVNVTQTPFDEYFTSWLPDGAAFAYISNETGKQVVYVRDANGRNQRQISQSELEADDAHWTRDGKSLIYVAVDRIGPNEPYAKRQPSQLILHNMETGEEEMLVEKSRITRMDISPDSDQVAYSSRVTDESPSLLCVLDLNTREEWCAEHEVLPSSDIAWGID